MRIDMNVDVRIIGNCISFVGALIMVGTGFIKKKDRILLAQCAQFGILGISNLVLGGVTGFISNILSIVRNLYCIKFKFGWPAKLVFVVLQAAISGVVNTEGVIGWFPVFCAALYTCILDVKDERILKGVIIFMQVLWCIYDFVHCNYVVFVMDIATIIANIVGIIMIQKAKSREIN